MSKTKLILTLAVAMLTAQVKAYEPPTRDNAATEQGVMARGTDNAGIDALNAIIAILEPFDAKQRDRIIGAIILYYQDPE